MCGLTVHTGTWRFRLGKGSILPRCIPTTNGSLRAPRWNPQSRSLPAPAPWTGPLPSPPKAGMIATPPKEISFSLGNP